MRIAPILVNYGKSSAIAAKGQSYKNQKASSVRNYTGNPCQDLAYASMFDKRIAQDLRLMGLI